MRTIDMGNNESVSVGLRPNADGTYTAMTFVESKDFSKEVNGQRWLRRRGYNPDGTKINREDRL